MKHLLLRTPDIKRKLLLLAGDILLVAIIILVILTLYGFFKERHVLRILGRPLKLYAIHTSAIAYFILLYIFEMYDIKERYEKLQTLASISIVALTSFLIMFALAKLLRINKTTMIYMFAFFILSIYPLFFWRRVFLRTFLSSEYFVKRVLFIGNDSLTKETLEEMKNSDYKAVGLLGNNTGSYKNDLEIIGISGNLGKLIRDRKIKTLVLGLNSRLALPVIKEIYKYKFEGLEVYRSDYFYEILTRKFAVKQYMVDGNVPFPNIDTFANPVFKNMKRLIDSFGALFGLTVLSPVFLIVAILIKLTSKGSVFYLQERIGFQEKPFNLIKFRTMITGAEKDTGPQWASKDDARTTKVGRFLRKVRLDELPQLINVLKGEISFIGPRAIRRHFADLIEGRVPFYSVRFSIKPGLTGWAQVHYGYGILIVVLEIMLILELQ